MIGDEQRRRIGSDTRLSILDILLRRLFVVLFCVFCFVYPFAVIGVAFNVQPPFSLRWAGSVLLFLEGTILILAAVLLYGLASALFVSLLVIVLSYLVEVIGVNTGFPFGRYHYTDILFLHLPGGVPLAVMFAWILIVLGGYAWTRSETRSQILRPALLGASLAALLDLAIEPVAAHVVHYWEWSPPGPIGYYGVPFANFVAWFLITLALLLLAGRFLRKRVAPDGSRTTQLAIFAPRFLFSTSLFMFGLVDLTYEYYIGALLALFAGYLLFSITAKRVR